MFKHLTSNKGFTLVEVIVVAVIVLILAAVAIPLYNGYIQDSRRSTARNVAGTVATFLGTASQQEGTVTKTGRVLGMSGVEFGTDASVGIPTGFTVTATANSVSVMHCGGGATGLAPTLATVDGLTLNSTIVGVVGTIACQ